MEPIFLQPVLQDKIWGGEKLKTQFDLNIPTKTTGEAWCISAHPHGVSTVISPEKYAGLGLDELYKNHKEIFGGENKKVFPLLTKILDANDDLSVQVHPDDEYSLANENELGKTECWYVISAEKNAKIIYGHNAKNKEEFLQMVENKEWKNLLKEIPVKEGDFFDVPAGTIHAIGKGVVILETQQNSDTTYRVYDYERKDNFGNERELHIKKSVDVASYPGKTKEIKVSKEIFESGELTHYLTNEYFTVYKLVCSKELVLPLNNKYTLATVIKGKGILTVDEKKYNLKIADSFILPNKVKEIKLSGELELILSKSE